MARPAERIHRTVFISISNPLSSMADTARLVQGELERVAAGVSGMALCCSDRWVCMLEGNFAEVECLSAGIVNITRPRTLHRLMTEPRAQQLIFPQHRIGWRFDAPLLEMAAFVNDLHRYSRRASLWSMSLSQITALLEPGH